MHLALILANKADLVGLKRGSIDIIQISYVFCLRFLRLRKIAYESMQHFPLTLAILFSLEDKVYCRLDASKISREE